MQATGGLIGVVLISSLSLAFPCAIRLPSSQIVAGSNMVDTVYISIYEEKPCRKVSTHRMRTPAANNL
ncbi:hypothetical protein PCANC_06280 [Puccinia coronata f. sp. avenae]|uniref:Secreted protein n=1 Tax=Puccinia coronata f. sp. avenae TaxID=200324 RepID=A0A2N5VRK3_9BASI|nr:hypothetical protein PCANC_06280 [Puccinia coronata f. sp. avenae]